MAMALDHGTTQYSTGSGYTPVSWLPVSPAGPSTMGNWGIHPPPKVLPVPVQSPTTVPGPAPGQVVSTTPVVPTPLATNVWAQIPTWAKVLGAAAIVILGYRYVTKKR